MKKYPIVKDPKKEPIDTFENKVTRWVGSRSSLVIHTIVFAGSFLSIILGTPADRVLLILTTIVSLEAIYLAIFIQMSVNKNTQSLLEVEGDIDEIQEDVSEITEEIEDLQEGVDEIQEDVGEITEEIDSIQEDVSEISVDIDSIQEDIEEEFQSKDKEEKRHFEKYDTTHAQLAELQSTLVAIMKEIDALKSKM